jgi:hypothetical protein
MLEFKLGIQKYIFIALESKEHEIRLGNLIPNRKMHETGGCRWIFKGLETSAMHLQGTEDISYVPSRD